MALAETAAVDYQSAFNIAVLIIGGLVGWALRSFNQSLKELKATDKTLGDKVQGIEVLIAGQYVRRDDLKDFTDAIFKKLDRIEEKLDGKVDKTHHHGAPQ